MVKHVKRVAIIGAGQAGVAAADVLTAGKCSVTLFSDESVPPYFRPRLPALAFGQTEQNSMRIRQKNWYEERKIDLRLDSPVLNINAIMGSVTLTSGTTEHFDAIIIATGSRPSQLRYEGDAPATSILTLSNMADALAIRKRLTQKARIIIIGGGILGIESAMRAARAGLEPVLVEHEPHLLYGSLGKAGEEALLHTLHHAGVTVRRDMALARLMKNGSGVEAHFVNTSKIAADWIISTIGSAPDTRLAKASGLATARGISTTPTLEISPFVYASGDAAQPKGFSTRCSARQAMLHGKLAAENLLAAFEGKKQKNWEHTVFPLEMKVENAEIHTFGTLTDPNALETRLDDARNPAIYQGCLSLNTRPVGVRMVGTRDKFDSWSMEIAKVLASLQ